MTDISDIGLPKVLVDVIRSLSCQELRSWQVYSELDGGSTVKVRFSAVHANMSDHVTTASIPQHTNNLAYHKKSPSQTIRDRERHNNRNAQRRTLKAKRRKIETVRHSESTEVTRKDTDITRMHTIESPENIHCEPPTDENLTLSPIAPLELNFRDIDLICEVPDGSILTDHDSDNDVKCPCCNKLMFDGNHVCGNETIEVESDESSDNDCLAECAYSCFLVGKIMINPPKSHGSDYFRCHSCGKDVCEGCMSAYQLDSKNPLRACCRKMMKYLTSRHYKLPKKPPK